MTDTSRKADSRSFPRRIPRDGAPNDAGTTPGTPEDEDGARTAAVALIAGMGRPTGTREENETVIRFDETRAQAYLWTASKPVARRWLKLGVRLEPYGGGVRGRVDPRAIKLRAVLPDGTVRKRPSHGGGRRFGAAAPATTAGPDHGDVPTPSDAGNPATSAPEEPAS